MSPRACATASSVTHSAALCAPLSGRSGRHQSGRSLPRPSTPAPTSPRPPCKKSASGPSPLRSCSNNAILLSATVLSFLNANGSDCWKAHGAALSSWSDPTPSGRYYDRFDGPHFLPRLGTMSRLDKVQPDMILCTAPPLVGAAKLSCMSPPALNHALDMVQAPVGSCMTVLPLPPEAERHKLSCRVESCLRAPMGNRCPATGPSRALKTGCGRALPHTPLRLPLMWPTSEFVERAASESTRLHRFVRPDVVVDRAHRPDARWAGGGSGLIKT